MHVKSGSENVGHPDVAALLERALTMRVRPFCHAGWVHFPARNVAKGKANLRLIDGGELVQRVLAHYEQFDSRYKGLLPLKRVHVPPPIDGDGGKIDRASFW